MAVEINEEIRTLARTLHAWGCSEEAVMSVAISALGAEEQWEAGGGPTTSQSPDDFAYWRRWIGDAVERIEIGAAVRGRNIFDPDRVVGSAATAAQDPG